MAKLLVHPDFFEFVIECIGFAQIMRIAELADEIGSAYQRAQFAVAIVSVVR